MSHRPKSFKLAQTLNTATRAAIDRNYPARVNGKRQRYKIDTTGHVDESTLAAIRAYLDTRDIEPEPAPEPQAVAVRGPRGRTGEIGPIGPEGPQGKRGPAGKDGEDGDEGQAGMPGPRGEKGEPGKRGPKGDRGDSGPPGAGMRGKRGRDGYDGGNLILAGNGPPPEGHDAPQGRRILFGRGEPDQIGVDPFPEESESD